MSHGFRAIFQSDFSIKNSAHSTHAPAMPCDECHLQGLSQWRKQYRVKHRDSDFRRQDRKNAARAFCCFHDANFPPTSFSSYFKVSLCDKHHLPLSLPQRTAWLNLWELTCETCFETKRRMPQPGFLASLVPIECIGMAALMSDVLWRHCNRLQNCLFGIMPSATCCH